jgi:hypothetical protein
MAQTYYRGKDGQFYPVSNNNNQGNNNQGQQQQFKRSGAVYSKIKNGNFVGDTIVNAWRRTKNGLMKATVAPYAGSNGSGTDIVTSEKHDYRKMLCTVSNADLGTSQVYHVLMNEKTKVITIAELSLCITPNGSGVTKKGKRVTGYFGTFIKST